MMGTVNVTMARLVAAVRGLLEPAEAVGIGAFSPRALVVLEGQSVQAGPC